MASQIKSSEAAEAKKAEKKSSPKRGIKNPFVYGGTIVILVITIIAFVFIPSIGGGIASGSAPEFGRWDGKPITYSSDSYFASQVAQINDYLRQQGLSEENFQLYAYQVWNMAFQSAVIRTALIDMVEKSGYRVTEKGLDEAMLTNTTFFVDDVFSVEKYNKTPLATRMTIRNTTRDDIMVQRYYEDLYTISPSTAEMKFVTEMAKPQRVISYIDIPLSGFPEADAIAWGTSNADLFRTIGISRITITSSESDAKKILAQVRDNKLSFEDAAKSHSQDGYADLGGDAGSVFYYLFAEGFTDTGAAAKIAGLAKGEVSDVYEIGEKAWAFFKINSEIAPSDFSSAETIAEIRAYIEEKERGTLESWAIAKANLLVTSTNLADFQKSAAKAGYEVKIAGPFMINLGNPTFYAYNQQIPLFQAAAPLGTTELSSAESDEAFMTELFSLEKGKVSKPLVVEDKIVVFGVTDDADASDDDTALVQFAYPYFHQQTIETQTRQAILASDKFKDSFSDTFFKYFTTGTSSDTSSNTTTDTATGTPTEE